MVKAMVLAVVATLALAGTANAAAERRGGLNLKTREVSGVVNINTASAHELELLPGVGVKTAKQIVIFREKQPFKAVAEITKVKGVGDNTYRRIKGYLAISGPTTLTVVKPGSAGAPRAAAPKPSADTVAAK